MKVILFIVSVAICEVIAPIADKDQNSASTHELYQGLPEQQRIQFLDYLVDKIKHTKKPNFIPSESKSPSKSSSSINSIKRYEECRHIRRYKPPTNSDTNTLTTTETHLDENIFNYRVGKIAHISNNGTVKIHGKIVYDKVEELRAAEGYKFKVENGTLIANGKIIFQNIPASKYTTENRVCNFQSGSDEISLQILENGTVKCTDSDHNSTFF